MIVSKRKIVLFVVFWVVIITLVFYSWQTVTSPNILVGKDKHEFLIIPTRVYENEKERKIKFKDIVDILKKKNFINDLMSFVLLSKITGLNEQFKAGRYKIMPNMSNIAVIRMINAGLQTPLSVSINNIRLVDELAEKITKNLDINKKEFLEVFYNKEIQKKHGFNENNFLCAFIPNTYQLYYTISPEHLIGKMVDEYNRFWDDEKRKKAEKNKLTPIDVCTLASIVQAETIKKKEFARVAGLYYNRLMKNIKLRADPTVVYATKKFDARRVTYKMLKVKSPYNTYIINGLPPGPINLPTIQVTNAVLNLEKHKYLFMCSKPDFSGYHNFAITYKEHKKNARSFRLALNKRKIFQ